MQFLAVLAVLATAALAQDLSTLPACAATCFANNFANSACNATNIACLCADKTFFNDVELCVLGGCNSTDALSTLTVASAACAAAGVPITKRSVPLFGRKH